MSICVVIPVFNESKRWQADVLKSFLKSYPEAFLLFVNDGSSDNSIQLIGDMYNYYPERVVMLSNQHNIGKANSIRNGMLYACNHLTVDHIGYLDSDLSVSPIDLIEFSKTLSKVNAAAIFGFRNMDDSNNVKRSFHRNMMGHLFRSFVKFFLRFTVIDSQCGAKLFNSELVRLIFSKPFQTRWLIDIEILMRLTSLYPQNNLTSLVIELPVSSFEDKKGSKLTPFELLRIITELFKLYIL